MSLTLKIVTIVILFMVVVIGALWTYKVYRRNQDKKMKHYSYWFTLSLSFTVIFGLTFVFAFFW